MGNVNPNVKSAALRLAHPPLEAALSPTMRMLRQVFRTKVTVIGTVIVVALLPLPPSLTSCRWTILT